MNPVISVIIMTLNEEKNIANAILSVRSWASEIIVVDMMSDDRTVEIARSLGAKIYVIQRVAAFDGGRRVGVENAAGEWIMLLDADELVPRKLARHLCWLSANGTADVYSIPRLNYFSGEPLLHTGFNPKDDSQIRFYRRGMVRITDVVHDFLEVQPNARFERLSDEPGCSIIHFSYSSAKQFIDKLNRYTDIGASQRKTSTRYRDRSLALAPLAVFSFHYLFKNGYRDGWRGFYCSFMMGVYRMTQTIKLRELRLGCDENGSARHYSELALQVLSEYVSEREG